MSHVRDNAAAHGREGALLQIDIPGFGALRLQHLVLDYNGTIACDGELIAGVGERLHALSTQLAIHVVTADTFGKARSALAVIPCQVEILASTGQEWAKLRYVQRLGSEHVVAIGNGRNDCLMLRAAALGIAVVLAEGAAFETIAAARIVTNGVADALNLLINPLRLVATLRC